jgi:hypothetical protein
MTTPGGALRYAELRGAALIDPSYTTPGDTSVGPALLTIFIA